MGSVMPRLSMMMFLQYAVWGVWLPTLAQYLQASVENGGLGFSSSQMGTIVGVAGAVGAITSPFVAGQFADRYFSTERFLAFLLMAGGIVQLVLASQTEYTAWLWLSIAYSVAYMPTLALTNSLAFANLSDANIQFPKVRVWGTIGWIAAGWIFPMVWLQTDLEFRALPPFLVGTEVPDATARLADSLRFSGVVSIVYAVFCFFLPHTPPKREGVESLAFAKAFRLMRFRSFALLVLASFPISVIHSIYFQQTAPFFTEALGMQLRYVAPSMTVGQFAEILIMAALGAWILKPLGFRWTIALGGLAYILRYGIWGFIATAGDNGADWAITVAVISQALHGFCYACFFAAAYIYVDRIAEVDVRHSAQTVFGIIILGGGPIAAGFFMGPLQRWFGDGNVITDFSGMWYTLSAIALVTTLVFALLFRDETAGTPAIKPEPEEVLGA